MNQDNSPNIRMDEMKRLRAFFIIQKNPETQAEHIARHYLECAEMARSLTSLIKIKKTSPVSTPEVDKLIGILTDRIKELHAETLGINLEWPEVPQDRPISSDLEMVKVEAAESAVVQSLKDRGII